MLIALCITSLLLLITVGKLIVMKRAMSQVTEQFRGITSTDTNTVISVNSRDKDIRVLANELNKVLVDVRKAYLRYNEGDMEMKMSITNISHDLRTPLTAILGRLELLKDVDKPKEVEETLEIIENRARYMKDLTEELFEYSVILSSDEEPVKEDVMLNQLLEDSLLNHYGALTRAGIEPEVDICEEKVIRKVNKKQIDRVFSNLMSNAIKYSKGDLTISLTSDGKVTFANKAPDLTPVEVEKLFNRFYTVQTARNSTGLGLAIARKFVTENGGSVDAVLKDGVLNFILQF
ncbi:MAG: HAMP domain-containing histidine kinase [Saccharofermentans sp.]|nr:HAMP domain-containing histidine kinase [Saccharofermentans sp.]